MDNNMSINQRHSPRIPIKIEVEFNHPGTGTITLMTKDISDSGIFIKMEQQQQPPLGTTARVRLKNKFEDGEEPPVLEMEVVRQSTTGIGLKFIL